MDAELESFKRSGLFRKLVEDAHNIEEDLRVFNAQYRGFVQRDDAAVGIVLRSHLIVEHFLDAYLAAANPAIVEWDKARLGFMQKLALADHERSNLHLLMPGLRSLNTIRNHVSHRLDTDLNDSLVEPMRDFITVWNNAAGKPVPNSLALIEEFALLASAWLHSGACMINRHVPSQGLLGLLAWYSDDEDTTS